MLHGLGANLYAVWVVAGALVMIQSLFDLGVASAVVRYVALAAAGSAGVRQAVEVIARRAMTFYILLSAVVSLPLWFAATPVAEVVHFLRPSELHSATVIVRWAAVAFALTNVTLVAASVLQGIERVDAAYRDQTLGWLLYLPLLAGGMVLWSHAQAVGLAWVGAYAVQTILLSRSLVVSVRRLPRGTASIPGIGQMLSFGARWQISAWADFATFQLPRLLGSAALTSGDLVSLDVAIRAGQLVVAPLFAFYPTVLPRAASLLVGGGVDSLRSFLNRFYRPGVLLLIAGTCVFIPLEIPLLAAWTGRAVATFNPVVTAAVVVGIATHASTGLLTSALLARGDVKPILLYKGRQLLLAVVLLGATTPIGLPALAVAVCLALTLPALAFNRYAATTLKLDSAWACAGKPELAACVLAQVAVPLALVVVLRSSLAPWPLLGVAAAGTLGCLSLSALVLARRAAGRSYLSTLGSWRDMVSSTRTGDHLARK